jgi:hypothetical protein
VNRLLKSSAEANGAVTWVGLSPALGEALLGL